MATDLHVLMRIVFWKKKNQLKTLTVPLTNGKHFKRTRGFYNQFSPLNVKLYKISHVPIKCTLEMCLQQFKKLLATSADARGGER